MAKRDTIVVHLDTLTKAALEIFAAKIRAQEGVTLTNTQAVLRALEMADPEAVEQARKASQQRAQPKTD